MVDKMQVSHDGFSNCNIFKNWMDRPMRELYCLHSSFGWPQPSCGGLIDWLIDCLFDLLFVCLFDWLIDCQWGWLDALITRDDSRVTDLTIHPSTISVHGLIIATVPFLHEKLMHIEEQFRSWKLLDRAAFLEVLLAVPAFADPSSLTDASTLEPFWHLRVAFGPDLKITRC